jgi:hypothetical protein
LLPALLIAACMHRKRGFSAKDLLIFVVSIILPCIVWAIVQFQGAPLKEILGFYANPQPGSLISSLATNLKNLFSDVGLLYLVVALILWISSVWIRIKKEITIDIAEVTAFAFSLLITLAFLRTAGYYRYLFPAQIVSLIYFPNSLATIFGSIRSRMNLSSLFETTIIPMLVIFLFVAGTYQLMFKSWVADYYDSHKTEFWKEYFEAHQPKNALFYDTPEVALFMKGDAYSQYLNLAPAAHISLGDRNISLMKRGRFDEIFIKSSDYEDMKERLARFYHPVDTPYKYTILERN